MCSDHSTTAPVAQPTQEPVVEVPVETPVETPVEETPVEETPVEEQPVEQPPVEVPVEETPVEETPVEQPPVEQPPVEAPATPDSGRKVYAHYMVGIVASNTQEQWAKEINDAKAVGIDGFALNCGPSDSYTEQQLHYAYSAAEAAGFELFISFDMAVGEWSIDQVSNFVNTYKDSSAQAKVNGLPLVSTFEGPAWADNWASVRNNVGGIYLVPDWQSLGPQGVADRAGVIDGAFSWAAWPKAGQKTMSSEEDQLYMNLLPEGKSYMMGVSPWFYTKLPQWNKNWYFSSDTLWYDRWQQAFELLPEMIEIITWNDFGESSYISDIVPEQIVSGAQEYINGYDHSALRKVLPHLIKSYKEGNANAVPTQDEAIAWYRTTPAKAGSNGGTIWGQDGGLDAADATDDVVNVMTITVDEVELVVSIGGQNDTFTAGANGQHTSFFQVPFNGREGDVTLFMGGREVVGPAISNAVPASGYVNFNSLAIGL